MTIEPQSITQKAVSSFKWSALTEIVSRTASPITFVILARLLTPNDFGLVAIATIAINFAQMFWDAGLSKALIQTKENSINAANIVFWTNLVLGIIIYIILFITAPLIAVFFNSPTSGPVLRILGIQIVIASLTSVQQVLFVRDLDFRSLFWVKLITNFIPAFFSIPLAIFGYGVWALVGGALAGQILNLIVLWHKSRWRPKFSFDTDLALKLFGFGIWAVGESLAAWFIMWGDNLLVGKFLGVHDLGVYGTGWTLVTVIFGLVLNPFLPVLYPTFSKFQDNLPALTAIFQKVNRVIIAIALPTGVGLLLVGPEMAEVLFGAKWHGLGFVLSVIGLMFGLAWLVGINAELYRAKGRPDINTKLMLLAILYYFPVYYIASQYGLAIFTITRLMVAVVAIPIHIYLCTRMLKLSPFYLWHEGKYAILATLLMGITVAILRNGASIFMPGLNSFMKLTGLIIAGVIVYTGSLWLMDRPFVIQTKGQIMRAVHS
jgi:O-antigen/teichoic acid export membrane protein